MKKVLFLLISLLTFSSHTEALQNRFCFNWDGCFKGNYRPGVYAGAQFGYAWILVPRRGSLSSDNFATCCQGHFAYGFFGGITLNQLCDNWYFGFEGGYNENGNSAITFSASHNVYRVTSHDYNLSATCTYAYQGWDAFMKMGFARVREHFKILHVRTIDQAILYPLRDCAWAPVINTGIGYSIWDWLNVSLAYRGVFSQSPEHIRNRLSFVTLANGSKLYTWHGVSTVHSVLGGVNVVF
jgi:OmpA-like transmembrane domain